MGDTTCILQECVILSHKTVDPNSVIRIRIDFIAVPDPAFYLNADPDPVRLCRH
jgi:hypothetical protein